MIRSIKFFLLTGFLLGVGMLALTLAAGHIVRADTPYCADDTSIGNSAFGDNNHSPADALKAMQGAGANGGCAADMVDYFQKNSNLPDRSMDYQSMAQAISGCRTGDAGSFTKLTYADCANSYYTCMQYAMNPKSCTDNSLLAYMSDGDDTICNGGRNATCSRLKEANQNVFNNQKTANEVLVNNACNGLSTSKGNSKAARDCTDNMNRALDSCASKGQYFQGTDQGIWTQAPDVPTANKELTDYKSCMQQAMNTTANDNQELCNAVNNGKGLYAPQDIADPNGSNTVAKGCHSLYSDFDNSAACAQVKGVWSQDSGKTGNDGWGCHDPNPATDKTKTPAERCDALYQVPGDANDPTYISKQAQNVACKQGAAGKDCSKMTGTAIAADPKNNASTDDVQKACADGANMAGKIPNTLQAPTGQCEFKNASGKTVTVKTNIISCTSQQSAAAAIGEVLKIGVYILTAAVGVLSVGGLAWASVRYAQARDNQADVSEAKGIIRNIIIGIIAYGFMMAIINFLLPGGLF